MQTAKYILRHNVFQSISGKMFTSCLRIKCMHYPQRKQRKVNNTKILTVIYWFKFEIKYLKFHYFPNIVYDTSADKSVVRYSVTIINH